MSKENSPADDVDFATLKAEWAALTERRVANFSAPRIPTKVLVNRLGIPRSNLNNWLTNQTFDLDADKHRVGNEDRLFSQRDAVKLTTASYTASIGLPLPIAKELSDHVADFTVRQMGMVVASHGGMKTHITIFRRPGSPDWTIVHSVDGLPKARIYENKTWKTEVAADYLKDLPPMRVEFDLTDFVTKILNELDGDGATTTVGTAADHDAVVAKTKRGGHKSSKGGR